MVKKGRKRRLPEVLRDEGKMGRKFWSVEFGWMNESFRMLLLNLWKEMKTKTMLMNDETMDWRRPESSPAKIHEFHQLELLRFGSPACNSCPARPH